MVDDDVDLSDLVALALGRAGFDARAVYDAESAIDAVCALDPHVVLIDLHMPRSDGVSLGQAMRQRSIRDVQLVMLTCDDQPCSHERSTAAGFAAHLVKPVPLRDLVRLVTVLRRQARRHHHA